MLAEAMTPRTKPQLTKAPFVFQTTAQLLAPLRWRRTLMPNCVASQGALLQLTELNLVWRKMLMMSLLPHQLLCLHC
jgi:hypothetical protein